jgi:spore coat polysaccharide biosynthesis protein SpsF
MKIVFCTQVRMGSSRLPGKVLLPIGEKRVIEWVLERSDEATQIDDTVLTIGDSSENDAIREWATRNGYGYSVGPENDLLARHRNVIEETNCDLLVRITGDCPFVPPSEIDRVLEYHRSNDAEYTTNRTSAMPIGTAVDVIEPSVLDRLAEVGATHPIKRLLDNHDDWAVAICGNDRWEEYEGTHTAVDTPADYWTLTDAVDAVGGDPEAVTQWVASSGST